MSRFRFSATIPLIATGLGLAILLIGTFLVRPAMHACYLSKKLAALQLGSSFDAAQRLAGEIGAKPYGSCDPSWCEWEVRMDNSELPRWWRGTGEAFVVAFDVKNSVVVRKNTGYGVGLEADMFYPSSVKLEEQEEWRREPGREQIPVQAGWQTTELFRYYSFGIRITPRASAEDRQRYTSFNFNCLWKYQGCKDARELLPAAKLYSPGPQSETADARTR